MLNGLERWQIRLLDKVWRDGITLTMERILEDFENVFNPIPEKKEMIEERERELNGFKEELMSQLMSYKIVSTTTPPIVPLVRLSDSLIDEARDNFNNGARVHDIMKFISTRCAEYKEKMKARVNKAIRLAQQSIDANSGSVECLMACGSSSLIVEVVKKVSREIKLLAVVPPERFPINVSYESRPREELDNVNVKYIDLWELGREFGKSEVKYVVSGAFSITPDGNVICSKGTFEIAQVAYHKGAEFFIVAESYKINPWRDSDFLIPTMLIESPLASFYFEVVPHYLITKIITDLGSLSPEELKKAAIKESLIES